MGYLEKQYNLHLMSPWFTSLKRSERQGGRKTIRERSQRERQRQRQIGRMAERKKDRKGGREIVMVHKVKVACNQV